VTSWRDAVLREFTPQVARLTLVADPDGLLVDEGILEGIRDRGFDLIEFDDHVAFRFAYESRYRSVWDRGEATDLVVVLRSIFADLQSLPFDLLQAGRRLTFSLGDLFPSLCTWVVAALDRADLDALWAAQARVAPGAMGENATKDFILHHVYGVAPELIVGPSDLLRVLLRRHYRSQELPELFDERFVVLLRQSGRFNGWSLETLARDRSAFFRFLQERWPAFIERVAASRIGSSEPARPFGLHLDGPAELPFDHDDVRVYIDDLFSEGLLQAIEHPAGAALATHWVSCGLATDPAHDADRRLKALVAAVRETLPASDARHQEWLAFAYRWGQLKLLEHTGPGEVLATSGGELQALTTNVQSAFVAWVMTRYAGLHNQPARPPVMVHHIPRALAFDREETGARIALVVADGLSLDQWLGVKAILSARAPKLEMTDGAVFAWVPTLTSVSRQALFAGRAPLYFPSSLFTTDREPLLWQQFWADHGLPNASVGYLKGLGDTGSLDVVQEVVERPGTRVIGLVVDMVDRIMHGMELGSRGMHSQIRLWAEQGYVGALLELLLDRGFAVYLTSDHGNVEATGGGRPGEGSLADLRGERARIYPDRSLRELTARAFPEALSWPGVGLPPGCHALLAPIGGAFVRHGERVVAHGGISVEELIVPFIKIERAGG
jgi:hypothetical protein